MQNVMGFQPYSGPLSNISLVMRRPVYAICEQQRHRSACASNVVRCIDSIISILAKSKISFSSWAGRFESYLVANPENRFSRDGAHIRTISPGAKQNIQNDWNAREGPDQPASQSLRYLHFGSGCQTKTGLSSLTAHVILLILLLT